MSRWPQVYDSCQETNGGFDTRSPDQLYLGRRLCILGVNDRQGEAMSFTTSPALVPHRDSLPFKKRDQRVSSPQQQQQLLQCDATNFKAPYPYKSHTDLKTKHMGLFRPVPRRVTALYQPWMQVQTPPRPKQHIQSAFREHHGWAEWRDFSPLPPGWDFSHQYQLQNHLSGARALHSGYPQYVSRFSTGSLVSEGIQRGGGGWERLKVFKDKTSGPHKGPYVRRGERRTDDLHRAERGGAYLPRSTHEDNTLKHSSLFNSTKITSGQSLMRVSPDSLNGASTPMKATKQRSPVVPPSTPTGSNRFPWLLPHFVAGSLIELRDGRLRRVENLQTEDFLLGSLVCPDLRLSCCTVQSISPSAASSSSSSSSSSVSRLLILLHEQQSQELVDVYVEYPFFVRGQGWSSCSPQKTAHLCGLQCRQLSVGDVCLALTPISAPELLPSDSPRPKTGPKETEDSLDSPQANTALCSQVLPELKELSGEQGTGTKASRRRHCSAP